MVDFTNWTLLEKIHGATVQFGDLINVNNTSNEAVIKATERSMDALNKFIAMDENTSCPMSLCKKRQNSVSAVSSPVDITLVVEFSSVGHNWTSASLYPIFTAAVSAYVQAQSDFPAAEVRQMS